MKRPARPIRLDMTKPDDVAQLRQWIDEARRRDIRLRAVRDHWPTCFRPKFEYDPSKVGNT